ncbi:MAG TPA: ABC transporter permease [Chloroflexota bacterium]|nr:ABC transporter permease [Chloroflexota bacterium]
MIRFFAGRLGNAIVVLLGVTLITFGLLELTGNPLAAMVPVEASPETVQLVKAEFALDQPLPVQYLHFLANAVQGKFGNSVRDPVSAMSLVLERIPNTLELIGLSLLIALAVGGVLGILAAWSRSNAVQAVAETVGLFGQVVPEFWLGIVLILVFAVRVRLLPASGHENWSSLVLPSVTLAAYPLAMTMRLTRSSLLEVRHRDYIRTANSKGLAPSTVLSRHALPNAAIPVVSYLGVQVARLLGGSIVVETVFGYPGMGLLAVQAISNRDLPVVEAFMVVVAATVVVASLCADALLSVVDPRIRYA